MSRAPFWNGRRVVCETFEAYVTAVPSVRGPGLVDLEAWRRLRLGTPEFAQYAAFSPTERWGLLGTELPADFGPGIPAKRGMFLEAAQKARAVIRSAFPEVASAVDAITDQSDANVVSVPESRLKLRYRPIGAGNAEPEIYCDELGRACWADRSRVLATEVTDTPANREAFRRRFELGEDVSFDLAVVGAIVAREGATVQGPGGREFRLWPAGGLARAVSS